MPNRDKTGPLRQGFMTGKGLGPCGGGTRRGLRMCLGGRFTRAVALTTEEEKKILEAELKEIDLEKQEIEKRLKEIK